MKLRELAERLGCELRGDGNVEITSAAPIESAGPGQVTFVANPRYARYLGETKASAVIVARDAPEPPLPALMSDDPYTAFARAIELFYVPLPVEPGIHPTAVIAPDVRFGDGVSIGPYCVIGAGVSIGAEARIGPHVVIYPEVSIGERFVAYARVVIRERVKIGNDVIVHAGAVIGSDGFGYASTAQGIKKIVQAGDVVIEDGVEIGANTTVDRATVGSTMLRRGVKLDNLVMVAHGCDVGEGSMLAAQVGLSGSTRVGRYVRMGGQVGVAGHLTIGDGVQIAAQSGVPNSVSPGMIIAGYPAVEIGLWRRCTAALLKLPELLRRVRRIEKRLALEEGESELSGPNEP